MSYITTLFGASSVRLAIKAEFLAPNECSLIIAKTARLEIYSLVGPSLVLQTKIPIHGRVIALAAFKPKKSETDHLLIVLGQFAYQYFTISWDPVAKKPRDEIQTVDVSDSYSRVADKILCLADPQQRMLGLHVYKGAFMIIPMVQQPIKGVKKEGRGGGGSNRDFDLGNLDKPFALRISELDIIDMAFLYGTSVPVLAILYKPFGGSELELTTYEIVKEKGERKLLTWKIQHPNGGQEAQFLIPIPEPLGGVLLLGVTISKYFDNDGNYTAKPMDPARVWVSWEILDFQTFLLGDESGKLHRLSLQRGSDGKAHIHIQQIGDISIPETLVYLGGELVFVGSHFGDSQLLTVSPGEPGVQVRQVFDNIGPMVDFRALDLGYSGPEGETRQYSAGHTRFISASGGYQQGRLRSIRSGIGLDDLGVLGEMEGIRGLWALKSIPGSTFDDVLVVSFIEETRIFKFDDAGGIEELEGFMGFLLDQRTVLAHNAVGGRLLQVTPTAVRLIDAESGTVISEVLPDEGHNITMASANELKLLYAMGPTLVILDLILDLCERGRKTFDHEISCATMPSAPSRICIVGFWAISVVLVLSVDTISTLTQGLLAGTDSASIPRSLLVARLSEKIPPTLLVAMGDGGLFTFSLLEDETTCVLSEGESITLGTQSIQFQAIPQDNGQVSVFATCDHPSVIYATEGRIVYAAVTADKSTYVTSFNSRTFPGAVVIASEDDLKLSVVDPLRTMHVHSLPVGDIVRRIVFSMEKKIIAVATVKQRIEDITGDDVLTSYVRLIDSALFSEVDSFELHEMELVESLACGKLSNGNPTFSERFLVGTAYLDGSKDECTRGRIIVFDVNAAKRLRVVESIEVKGPVKGIQMVGEGKFVVAMGKTVDLYAFEYPDDVAKTLPMDPPNNAVATGDLATTTTRPRIVKLASFRAHCEPFDVAVYNNIIAAGDVMKGPSLLELVEGGEDGNFELREVAKIFRNSWLSSLELLNEGTVVCGDSDDNLAVWQRQTSGVTHDDRMQLQLIGSIKVGEFVNKIRRISNQTLTGCKVQPKAYFSTVDGSIFLLGEIAAPEVDLLMNLQSNLAKAVKGLGGIDFLAWRAMSTSFISSNSEPVRFVDGDFIETFLDLPDNIAQAVVDGNGKAVDKLGVSVEDIKALIETFKRLR